MNAASVRGRLGPSARHAFIAIVALGSVLASLAAMVTLAGDSRLARATKADARVHLQGKTSLQQAERAGIDIGGVIETISHRFAPVKESASRLVSEDRSYRTELGASGFSLTLRRRLTESELTATEKAWRADHPPEPGHAAPKRLPAQAIPFQHAPAFAIRTSRVSRGDASLTLSRGRWRSSRNSAVRVLAPALRERVTAREGHLEWDFLLDRGPAPVRPLTVEARIFAGGAATRVRGARPAWRFAVGAGRSVRMGTFRVKDARGRWLFEALPALAASTLTLKVPARVLREADYPLTIDPSVSPEYPVSDPVYGSAPGTQSQPALAFDGTNYLAAWLDLRSSGYEIYGTRLSPAGTVLDPGGIAISTVPGLKSGPAIAFAGSDYLVAWTDYRSGFTDDIYGARVSTGGTVLDPGGVAISTAPRDQRQPAVAADSTDYLVTWNDGRSGLDDIYGARVSAAGVVLDPSGIAISTAPNEQLKPAVAFDGANYLVAWGDARSGEYRVFAARVSRAGSVLDPSGITISGSGGANPAIAFDGTNYLVAWQSGANDIYGARVSPAGIVLDSQGIAISTGPNYQLIPVIAFGGGNYLVAWTDYRAGATDDIYGARVSTAGVLLDSDGIAISTAPNEQWAAAVGFDGSNYLVAFTSQNRPNVSDYDIRAARVSLVGSVLDPDGITISIAANTQHSPAVAFDGTNYLVVWRDERSANAAIYGARVSQAGAALDGSAIAVSAGASGQSSPAVVFDGTNYLVAWADGASGIRGARVSQAGTVLDPNGIAFAASGYDPAVAFDGTNYLVVWADSWTDPDDRVFSAIDGARVSPEGFVLGGIAIWTTGGDALAPAVAFDGANYLVVWGPGSIYGARVSPNGVVLDPSGIVISTGSGDEFDSTIAFDGTNYLVAWADSRTGGTTDIYGARVRPDGTVLDPSGIAISTAANAQTSPALAFDGADYLVAWADARAGVGIDRIYGARVSPNGAVLDPDGFAISATSDDEELPAAVGGGTARAAVAYERVASELLYGRVSRVFLRLIDDGSLPPLPPDTTPPETTITSGPSGTTSSTLATFEFTANEPSTFECSLDSAPFAACTSPASYSGLVNGSHTVRVRATDMAGNVDSTPAERSWTVQENMPPVASFTFSCSALTCSLDGSASGDPDGTIQAYSWDFGDGASGSGETATHTYAQATSYTVTLTVTDNAGASATTSQSRSLIALSVGGYKVKGLEKVDLSWTGPGGTSFDVYRDGGKIATVQAAAYTDNLNTRGAGTYTYKVCAPAASTCSNQTTVSF
jgi:large repetitive protein